MLTLLGVGQVQNSVIREFITTWRTTTSNETITIPTNGNGYNYDITTSDGQTFTNVTGNQVITFAVAGDYDVRISGDFPSIFINNGYLNKDKIIDIKQWGSIAWGSFQNSFFGCSNLVSSFTDAPNLKNVTNARRMFSDATSFNNDLSAWDVSNVTDMQEMFDNASSFTSDLSAWNVSSVTRMTRMFDNALLFNSDLSAWNLSSSTNTSFMFTNAESFTSDLSSWNVSSVTNMRNMFQNALLFNSDLSSWNVSSVIVFGSMFDNASSFTSDLSSWNISNANNMTDMFSNITLSTLNYDAILVGWEAILQSFYPNGSGYTPTISISFGNSQYTGGGSAETARASLISNFNWTITDGGEAPEFLLESDNGFLLQEDGSKMII
tara:strand:+ start:275 stop:1414 length:1140 start_codon:yes stop_codon:yes gene_type:complete